MLTQVSRLNQVALVNMLISLVTLAKRVALLAMCMCVCVRDKFAIVYLRRFTSRRPPGQARQAGRLHSRNRLEALGCQFPRLPKQLTRLRRDEDEANS